MTAMLDDAAFGVTRACWPRTGLWPLVADIGHDDADHLPTLRQAILGKALVANKGPFVQYISGVEPSIIPSSRSRWRSRPSKRHPRIAYEKLQRIGLGARVP
jgi:hypothetical protein